MRFASWIAFAVAPIATVALVMSCASDVQEGDDGDGDGSGGAGNAGSGGEAGAGGGSCVPAEETCDGLDNDCDGDVDEPPCTCQAGQTQACYSGAPETQGIGECADGSQTCLEGGTFGDCTGDVTPIEEVCNDKDDDCNDLIDDIPDNTCGVGACETIAAACNGGQPVECVPGSPTLEVCDGADNDCDQQTDETFPGLGGACNTMIPGVCSTGAKACMNGSEVCVPDQMPVPESCDGLDNDCNGTTDDNVPGTGGMCSTGADGVCSPGLISCSNGVVDCFSLVMASPELCDGLDNDCDALTDENNPQGGAACNTGQPGICAPGTITCQNASLNCVANQLGAPEVCDGLDNNCNGVSDDGNPGGGIACNTGQQGVCSAGTTNCINAAVACTQNVQPSPEVCDGLDNNCAGGVDNGNPGGGAACVTGLQGACSPGTITCTGAQLQCVQNVQPVPEICGNGIDDDCNGVGDPNVVTYFTETFANNNAGWQLGPEWQIQPIPPGATCGDPLQDHTPTADNGIAGVIVGGCSTSSVSKTLHGFYYLTSPIINTAAFPTIWLEFWRELNTDYLPYMNSVIEVYNGASWVQIYQNGNSGVYDANWVKQSFNITAHKNANMRVRFGFSIGSSGVFSVGSWNVDDLAIVSAPCQ